VLDTGRPMDRKAHFNEPVDDGVDLRFRRYFLHDD
jgi:hypothetical protein